MAGSSLPTAIKQKDGRVRLWDHHGRSRNSLTDRFKTTDVNNSYILYTVYCILYTAYGILDELLHLADDLKDSKTKTFFLLDARMLDRFDSESHSDDFHFSRGLVATGLAFRFFSSVSGDRWDRCWLPGALMVGVLVGGSRIL